MRRVSGVWCIIVIYLQLSCGFTGSHPVGTANFVLRSPEIFEIVPKTVKITARKNLAQVSKVLTQIVTGREFGDDQPIFIPINDFVREASGRMTAWLLEGKFYSL